MRAGIAGGISLVLLVQSVIAQQLPKEETPPESAFAKATAAVNAKLKDPQSARYGDMVRKLAANDGKPTEVVCGTVSAADSVGRYGRNRPFVYFIADGRAYLVEANPQPEDVAQIIYRRFCK
jgi:hypothetical protein